MDSFVDNLQFADSHLAIFLEQRKNDQFREGSWVFIASCPVAVVENFFAFGKHTKGSKLFRRILSTKNGIKLREEQMSYSRAKELMKKELQREGLDPKLYGLHSLRSEG